MQRRVVVTGLGVISALGGTSGEFWQALQAGRSGIAPIEAVDRALLRFSNGAEVRNYSPARYFDEKEIAIDVPLSFVHEQLRSVDTTPGGQAPADLPIPKK